MIRRIRVRSADVGMETVMGYVVRGGMSGRVSVHVSLWSLRDMVGSWAGSESDVAALGVLVVKSIVVAGGSCAL